MRLTYKNQLRTLQSLALAGAIGIMTACGSDDDGPDIMPAPTITSFTPDSGFEGETITINGTNFSTTNGDNTVTFSGNASATVTSASATSLQVTVPSAAVSGPVSVMVDGQTGSSSADFTVLEEQTPVQALIDDGASVGTDGGYVRNTGWGYKFTALTDGSISEIGLRNAGGNDMTVYLWAEENEILLDSLTIPSSTDSFNYVNTSQAIQIESGKSYRIVAYTTFNDIVTFLNPVTYPINTGDIRIDGRAAFQGENLATYPSNISSSVQQLIGLIDIKFITEK
jgi:hypothetical protein